MVEEVKTSDCSRERRLGRGEEQAPSTVGCVRPRCRPWLKLQSCLPLMLTGLGSESPVKLCKPALLQKGAPSFPKELSLEDNPLVRTVTDIDANLLTVLPKEPSSTCPVQSQLVLVLEEVLVLFTHAASESDWSRPGLRDPTNQQTPPTVSELRKQFEAVIKSEPKMNRKERIARRLEGIETDVPSALASSMQHTPGLVTNRLLEEDTPRYTRASDSSEPGIVDWGVWVGVVVLRRYSRDEVEAPERPSRSRTRPDHQPPAHPAPVPNSGPDPASLSSKAERIARYKAERRRQLSERYGILLEQEADTDYMPRYMRARRESDLTEKLAPPDRGRGEKQEARREEEGLERSSSRSKYSSSGMGRVSIPTDSSPAAASSPPKERRSTFQAQEKDRRSLDSERERERAMNLENYRRTPDRSPRSRPPEAPVTAEMTPAQPTRGAAVAAVPSSPRTARRASLPSNRSGISPGDLFIEQQAQNILSRQG
ncbi:hypothetical protein NFI96_000489 [Prochilodus magdalenae]|nr:hypothetical protein NFI96_000489 [Prochilodus magdalenae]